MRDLLNVRSLLGLGVLTHDERRLIYEACLYAGGANLKLPSASFVRQVLEDYRSLPQSVGKRLELKRLQKKVMELGGRYVRGSSKRRR